MGKDKDYKKEKHSRKRDVPESETPAASTPTTTVAESSTPHTTSAASIAEVVLERGAPIEPYTSFTQYPEGPLREFLLTKSGFKAPSSIQSYSWPALLRGDDLISIADTGSGKTLGFLAPACTMILNSSSSSSSSSSSFNAGSDAKKAKKSSSSPIRILVLAPTRELALQIHDVAKGLCVIAPQLLKSCCVVGGLSKYDQINELRSLSPSIVIATPGRLFDLVDCGELDLGQVQLAVLDEADRMLDMGFEPQIRRIFSRLPPSDKRLTAMFSATWPVEVQALAKEFLRAAHLTHIKAGSSSRVEHGTANSSVTQAVRLCRTYWDKKKELVKLLTEHYEHGRILVFMLYKKTTERMYQELYREGWPVGVLHGDKSQYERNAAMEAFKSGQTPILIATDVAARGLDVKDIRMVVNVEMPLVMEDYVHRVGRTGRAGAKGLAVTLFCEDDDKEHAQDLLRILRESGQTVSKEFEEIARRAPPPKRMTKKQEGFKLGHIDVHKGASGANLLASDSPSAASSSSSAMPTSNKKVYFD